jgi:hypothetical protein
MRSRASKNIANHVVGQILAHFLVVVLFNSEDGRKKTYQENLVMIHGIFSLIAFLFIQYAFSNS